jgi:3D (Asp-Asp-Asp) domain-containing protein
MKFFDRFNTAENARIKRNISLFLQKYSRVTVYGLIILLMVIVCIVSLVNKSRTVEGDGTEMSMTELAADTKPFAGKSFDAEILTYDDMLQIEGEQGTDLTEAEQQRVNEILSSIDTDALYSKSQSITLTEGSDIEVVTLTPVASESTDTANSTGTTGSTGSSLKSATPVYATADGNYQYLGEYLLTAYCPCPICCGAWSNYDNPITASGATAQANHTIAVDTSVIPFGSEVLINGQVYVAEDRGSAINGNHIDIFYNTHEEALAWGKQYSSVYIKISN